MAETKYAGIDTAKCPSSTVSAQLKGYGSGNSPTPFWYMGFYLGGCCFVGSGYGTTSYNYLTKQGWNLVPIWVSVQNSPCDTSTGTDKCPLPSTSEGISSAQYAADKATAVGFPAGSTIYLDVETSGTLTSEYIDFVTAWVSEIKYHSGYSAGIYCHPLQAKTLQSSIEAKNAGPAMWWVANYLCPKTGEWLDSSGVCIVPTCTDPIDPTGNAPQPDSSGFSSATTWQYAGDVMISYNGACYEVDLDVSEFANPGLLQSDPDTP